MISAEIYTQIIKKYINLQVASVGRDVPISHVARASKVNWHMAKKSILCHKSKVGYEGMNMSPFWVSKVGDMVRMDNNDECYMLYLRFEDPFRSNMDYVLRMRADRGIEMSESTVSRWFQHRFERKSSALKAIIVPIDKFRPLHILNYEKYCHYIVTNAPKRCCFTDENSFKATE